MSETDDGGPDDDSRLRSAVERIARNEGRSVRDVERAALRMLVALSPAMRSILLLVHDDCTDAEWRAVMDMVAKEMALIWDAAAAAETLPVLERSLGLPMRTSAEIRIAVDRMLGRDDPEA